LWIGRETKGCLAPGLQEYIIVMVPSIYKIPNLLYLLHSVFAQTLSHVSVTTFAHRPSFIYIKASRTVPTRPYNVCARIFAFI
jgi:hypothetical protein